MGFKMKGPSLYKPNMANMDIQKDYAKKSDDRAMSSPYQKTDPPTPEFPGLIAEVPVSGGKKTEPGSFIQTKRGSSTAGNSVEHQALRDKKKKNKKVSGSEALTAKERARLNQLDKETEIAYKKKYKGKRK